MTDDVPASVTNDALGEERLSHLLSILKEEGRLLTREAARKCRVSVDTIRRDLAELDRRGLVKRVHGGALLQSGLPASYAGRKTTGQTLRLALAEAITSRLRNGQVVGLDAGTTGVEVARRIPKDLALTLVTTSPPAAVALAEHPSVAVVMVGGHLDVDWMAVHGVATVDTLRTYRFDVGIIGACGVHPDDGVSTGSLLEVDVKRAFIERSAEVILPAPTEKLNVSAAFSVAPLSELTTLVTDSTNKRTLEPFRKAGLEVVRVKSA